MPYGELPSGTEGSCPSRGLTLEEKAFSLSSMTLPLAFAMGFSVASLPGPIIALIATETLRKGVVAGLLIVTAPILIDAIVIVSLALFFQVSIVSERGAAGLGIIGGCFLVWLGAQCGVWILGLAFFSCLITPLVCSLGSPVEAW